MGKDRLLTEAQIDDFRGDGFVVVRGMFDEEEMARIVAWSDEMESRSESPGAYMKYFEESLRAPRERILQRLENFYPYHDGFGGLFDGKLRQASAELFGAEAVLFKDKINFKKPGGDGFKPHQDQQAGWGTYADLFVTAVRLRLGASHAAEPQLCQQCGAVLAPTAYHASCCAPGASTEGHNDVRDALLDLAKVADATSEPEVLGLFASAPDLRPADVLTSALGGNLSHALDVGIAAPLAANAGPDYTESMRKRKVRRYARRQGELEEQRITYRPLIWSAWGREHPDTSSVLVELAKVASRRRGLADYRPVLARARAGIGIAIARRAARMILSCQARLGKRQLAILGR